MAAGAAYPLALTARGLERVALAALICAYHEAPDAPGGLRATLLLAGRTLVERQARIAAQTGASPIVILVERLPPQLAAVVDQLRAEAVSVLIARSAVDAAQAIPPQDQLLIVGDGLIVEPEHVSRLLSAGCPALLTIPDSGVDERFERIDGDARWAGLALLDGATLHQTAAMLQDWDLQSTLLRCAVQAGARQIAMHSGAPIVIAERQADLETIQNRLLQGSGGARADWPSSFLLAPIEASATRALMPSPLTPAWLYVGAAVLTGLAAILFGNGWLWIGGALLLMATPLDGIAERLAALRLEKGGASLLPARILPYLAGGALMALSYDLAKASGWGTIVLATTTILFLSALSAETRRQRLPEQIFFAERKGLTWLMLPFAIAGAWVAGLALVALYAAGSFFWAQREVHRRSLGREQD